MGKVAPYRIAEGRTAAKAPEAPTAPALPGPVGPLVCALLDTAARAADARWGLRAGPLVRAFYAPACAPAWTAPTDSLTADTAAALRLLTRAAEYGRPAG